MASIDTPAEPVQRYTDEELERIRETLRRANLSTDLTPGGYTIEELDRALRAPDWVGNRLRRHIMPDRGPTDDELEEQT
jgi:hypothetical protein